MAHLGSIFQVLGLLSGIVSVALYGVGFYKGKGNFSTYAKFSKALMLFFLFCAVLCLCSAVFSDNFNLRYVAVYSDRTLPFFYKISVLWAGQSGALLVACLVICCFSVIASKSKFLLKDKYACAEGFVSTIFIVLFLSLSVFVVNPFVCMDFIPANGRGLSPLLQNMYIFFYPIFVCFWVSGALIIFSRATAALAVKNLSSFWIKSCRGWIYFSWFSLIGAIIFKSLWMYNASGTLWKWTIEETICILSLFALLAFIHTSSAYLTRGRMKTAVFLSTMLFFQWALLLLYIVHSGSETGINPFKYTYCGSYFLGAMVFFFLLFVLLLNNNKKSFTVSKAQIGSREYYFYKIVNICFALAMLFIFCLLFLNIFYGSHHGADKYYFVLIVPGALLCVFFIFESFFCPLFIDSKANKSKTPFIVAYLGLLSVILVAIIGYIGKWEGEIMIHPNQSIEINGLTIVDNGVSSVQKYNYVSTFVDISLSYDKKMIGNIYPEIRGYNNSNILFAETKTIVSGLGVISAAFLSYDFSTNEARLLIMSRPFVLAMIPGIFVFVLGVFGAVWSNRND